MCLWRGTTLKVGRSCTCLKGAQGRGKGHVEPQTTLQSTSCPASQRRCGGRCPSRCHPRLLCFPRSSETLLVVGGMNQLSHFTSRSTTPKKTLNCGRVDWCVCVSVCTLFEDSAFQFNPIHCHHFLFPPLLLSLLPPPLLLLPCPLPHCSHFLIPSYFHLLFPLLPPPFWASFSHLLSPPFPPLLPLLFPAPTFPPPTTSSSPHLPPSSHLLTPQVEYLLSEWVRHFHQPGLLREGDKIYAAYVARVSWF